MLILQRKVGTGDDLFEITNLAYNGVKYSYGTAPSVYGFQFKPDGSRMYILSRTPATIHMYTLSTPWDLTTLSLTSSTSITIDRAFGGLAFASDGTKFYCGDDLSSGGNDYIKEYTLSTPWDTSTVTATPSFSFSVHSEDGQPKGVEFKPDGTQMYIAGDQNRTIFQYTLSTAWDLSTASYASKSFVVPGDANPYDVDFSNNGTRMFVYGTQTGQLRQFDLSVAWDVSTAVSNGVTAFVGFTLSSSEGEGFIPEIDFNSNGTKVYALGSQTKYIYELDLV